MKFGERLKRERMAQQLTQREMAGQLNVSRQTISSWETGNSYPDIDSLIRLSDAYQISLDVLLKEDSGMKEYLKKQEVMDEIKPIVKLTTVIDLIFIAILLVIPVHGIAGGLVMLMGLLNIAVLQRIQRFQEAVTGERWVNRWSTRRLWLMLTTGVLLVVALGVAGIVGWQWTSWVTKLVMAAGVTLAALVVLEITYRLDVKRHPEEK
ncbi:helix-turn-helix domain-containing protein [Secundilactobacillus muriivasis]